MRVGGGAFSVKTFPFHKFTVNLQESPCHGEGGGGSSKISRKFLPGVPGTWVKGGGNFIAMNFLLDSVLMMLRNILLRKTLVYFRIIIRGVP